MYLNVTCHFPFALCDSPLLQDVLPRVTQWLIARRDSSTGGFKRSATALDGFGFAPQLLTDVYILNALVTAGVKYPEQRDDLIGESLLHKLLSDEGTE
jgi:hypothetical protein